MTNVLDPRTPVLVGVGTASEDAEAVELMVQATEAALADAGGQSLAGAIDRVAVPQGSWAYVDPARLVAERVGARRAKTRLVELGIAQQSLINDALAAILSGAADVAVVAGGEAKRWVRDREKSGLPPIETAQPGTAPDVIRRREGPLLEPVEVAHRLWDPVQQYAMIDNALRAAEGGEGGSPVQKGRRAAAPRQRAHHSAPNVRGQPPHPVRARVRHVHGPRGGVR